MKKCLICRELIEPFISFGRMPIANGFLSPNQFENEYFYELQVAFCPNCAMVQLAEQVDPLKMFHKEYAFYSSTSTRMAHHFRTMAEWVKTNHLKTQDPFVMEIGSNDGIMLQNFAQAGIRHLGIDPSENVAQAALKKGVATLCEFFDERIAERVMAQNGPADVVIGANVMCHIPDLHSVFAGVKRLLKPEGLLIFEDPYLADIVEKIAYDQFYDEHVFYFSLRSIRHLADLHGLEVIDIAPQDVHGGSMRYIIAHKGARQISPQVSKQLDREDKLGLYQPETYVRFRDNVQRSRDSLLEILIALNGQGKRVVGYGATSKSTTVINTCGISPDLIEFISDTTPIKQGKFSPGMHIPVRSYQAFKEHYPDIALLFAWNHMAEIMSKEDAFRRNGGKWLVYVPEIKVL